MPDMDSGESQTSGVQKPQFKSEGLLLHTGTMRLVCSTTWLSQIVVSFTASRVQLLLFLRTSTFRHGRETDPRSYADGLCDM